MTKLYIFLDIDNNGFLDQNDFLCMAVRACVVEGKGDCSTARLDDYKKLMKNLWDEISAIADDDKVFTLSLNIFRCNRQNDYDITKYISNLFLLITRRVT